VPGRCRGRLLAFLERSRRRTTRTAGVTVLNALTIEIHVGREHLAADQIGNDQRGDVALAQE
jgi:hypothetical protein